MNEDSLFYEYVDDVINIEGGYVNNPNDSGGPTNFGVTEATAREFGYRGDMRDFTKEQAKEIYKKEYWDSLSLDEVAEISEGLSFELFDTGINCGIGTSAVFLQRVLNVLNNKEKYYEDISVDGMLGPKTISALKMFYAVRKEEGAEVLTKLVNCLQGARYVKLAEQREKDEEFMYGWALNRL